MPASSEPAAPGVDVVGLTRSLVDIDSTTGREGNATRFLASYLDERGFPVRQQVVAGDRFNIIVGSGQSPVCLSTHVDCVPPFFSSRIEGNHIYGRGACDAKGILAAQVGAADLLRRVHHIDVGLLFVVGEERGSDGARLANLAAEGCRFMVNGEPTESRLALATRGMVRYRLRASGRAAHSSFPELGESAIDKLIDALIQLRGIDLPSDEELGRTHYSVGLINGGVAPNVVSPSAEAEVMFRTVSDAANVREALGLLEPLVSIEHVRDVPPIKMTTVPGFDTAVFPYTTDIPLLSRWGQPLLFGPGSIHVAHTAQEFIDISELQGAVEAYVAIVRALLERAD